MTILPSNSVNLCHAAGPHNSLVTLTVTRHGMKISSVTLNPDRSTRGPVSQKEIQPFGACIGIDLVLPPESTLVIRKLMKISKEFILDGAVVLSPPKGLSGPVKPLIKNLGNVSHHGVCGVDLDSSANVQGEKRGAKAAKTSKKKKPNSKPKS